MSRKWLVLIGLMAFCVTAIALTSCSDDKGTISTAAKDTLYVKAVSTSPDTTQILTDVLWDDIEEVSIRIGEDKNYTNDLKLGIVRAKAMVDSAYIYLWFNWRDSTESVRPGYWTHLAYPVSVCPDLELWSQNADSLSCSEVDNLLSPRWENEDVLALLIDMGNNGTERAGCNTTCHADADTNDAGYRHYTTGDGNIDGWVWRAGRMNPLGLVDDQLWGPKSQTRRDDSYQAAAFEKNIESGRPKWMHNNGTSDSVVFLFDVNSIDMVLGANWKAKDGLPGYRLNTHWNVGNTSRYDIKCKSSYSNADKRWTVVMWRRLETPYPAEDVNLKDGRKNYQATLAVMDHAISRHSGSKPFTIHLP